MRLIIAFIGRRRVSSLKYSRSIFQNLCLTPGSYSFINCSSAVVEGQGLSELLVFWSKKLGLTGAGRDRTPKTGPDEMLGSPENKGVQGEEEPVFGRTDGRNSSGGGQARPDGGGGVPAVRHIRVHPSASSGPARPPAASAERALELDAMRELLSKKAVTA